MARDDIAERHKIWLGMVQPVGLVVSPPALAAKQAVLSDNVIAEQQTLSARVADHELGDRFDGNFAAFATEILQWPPEALRTDAETLQKHELVLTDYQVNLRPDYAVHDIMDGCPLLMLVRELPPEADFDAKSEQSSWHASHHDRFERLLRDAGVSTGLIFNGRQLRIIYAPRGETSGHITFEIGAMTEVAGRPILGALILLLGAHRLFDAPNGQRLPDLLSESRKYQTTVSTLLAEQVLDALWDMLRGFQAADEIAQHKLIGPDSGLEPEEIYAGLLASLLRLVFLLYAEDQGLMPNDPVYQQNYAVSGLFTRLRDDAAQHPDTMDQRFGAWGWLLSLFRLVYDGTPYTGFRLPARHGKLFDPDAHPFLEGRAKGSPWQKGEKLDVPRVSDGCIFRVLSSLLLLDGERLSYRSLDVEQIGSVYEAVMGFEVQRAEGRSIGVRKPKKGVSVDVVFDVDALLQVPAKDRAKRFKELTESDLPAKGAAALKEATTAEEVVDALGKRKSRRTPELLPPGALYLQPGEERRRTGSHYTPRSLTEPIVQKTLEPILKRLGDKPTPQQILDLKVCDPAMGSGAFLVETCRQLAEHLVRAWEVHNAMPRDMLGEEPRMHARRLVAQRCLYGVDKNPFAVDLAKLSLWLVTLAKNQPFTFLDHALRCGDSLVGLSRLQIARFHWEPKVQREIGQKELEDKMEAVSRYRREILDGGDHMLPAVKAQKLRVAEQTLQPIRDAGDLVIAAFFGADKPKAREELRDAHLHLYNLAILKAQVAELPKLKQIVANLRSGDKPVTPFHWEIEFPEVFDPHRSGFDAVVGNPPFLGGTKISTALGSSFLAYITEATSKSGNRMDLVGYFFRRAYELTRDGGSLGFIGSNTVAQGDTRVGSLEVICASGGEIYAATPRTAWPGQAAVVVSIIHCFRGKCPIAPTLMTRPVHRISAFLVPGDNDTMPARLVANSHSSFEGFMIAGQGFLFDDNDPRASTLAEMKAIIDADSAAGSMIAPYLGGRELNSDPSHRPHRYAINFGSMTEEEARRSPSLFQIVEEKVKPERDEDNRESRRLRWWQYGETRPGLVAATAGLSRVLACSQTSAFICFAFLPTNIIWSTKLKIFPRESYSFFCVMQSRLHELWAKFFGSTMKDDPVYVPTDCFETFPFPNLFEANEALESAGNTYYDFRANLMVRNDEGLTTTYNRFHDPAEPSPDISKLRELHAAMDRAVLDAYGWQDIQPVCGFGLDYLELDDDAQVSPEAQQVIDSGNLWFPTAEEAQAFAIGIGHTGRKRLPWRYRWPEETRDEVLARLLDLNAQRAKEEQLSGQAAQAKEKKKAKAKPRKAKPKPKGADLFD